MLGISRKPLSSRNTRWVPRRSAFFYMRPLRLCPAFDGGLVSLEGAPLGFLPRTNWSVPPDEGSEDVDDVEQVDVTPDQSGCHLRAGGASELVAAAV
jgi:hypothetical protein